MDCRTKRWALILAGTSAFAAGWAEGGVRRVSRDFPHSALCPINQGWLVDVNGDPVPPPGPPDDSSVRVRSVLVFTAPGPAALLRIEACDRSSALGSAAASTDGDALKVAIDDFAVVRKDVWQRLQVARPGPIGTGDCYQDGSGGNTQSVGSIFDPAVLLSAVRAFTCDVPFADNFDSPATSQQRWVLDGAELQNGQMLLANAVDAFGTDNGRFQCSSASVRLSRLAQGRDYVVDFSWSVFGPGFNGETGEEGFTKVQAFVDPMTAPVLGPRPLPPSGGRKPGPGQDPLCP